MLANTRNKRTLENKMTLTEQNQKLAEHLWAVTEFCRVHRGKAMPWVGTDTSLLFRYIASCYYHGKLNVAYNQTQIEAVAFCWADFRERIEAKYENNLPQFQWQPNKAGDALFIADVMGTRAAVARLYAGMIMRFPNLMGVPFLTYRRGKLVELDKARVERFARKVGV